MGGFPADLTFAPKPLSFALFMYAIVRTGGKQLRVAAGDVVRIEKPAGEKIGKGATLALSGASVILVSGDQGVRTGTEALKGVTVQAKVLGTIRTRKVLVFKKKRTKQYRRTKGHRQTMVEVRIEAIEG
jgi:large subunit ribosomal protein L21